MTVNYQEVVDLAKAGWNLVAIRYKSKNPGSIVGEEWQHKCTSDPAIISAWTSSHRKLNFGLLLGPKSGIIDLEYDSEEGQKIIEEACSGVQTPSYKSSKSVHRLFQYDERFQHEKKVFSHRGTEWRFGQDAAQSVIPPSCHDTTDAVYSWLPGLSPREVSVARLPDHLWELFNRLKNDREKKEAAEKPVAIRKVDRTGEGLIDAARQYLEATAWETLLEKHGWTFCRNRGEAQDWFRPGKTSGSISGTVNFGGTNTLRVFSSSCSPLEQESSYDKFAFVCLLEYEDDPIQAAKKILPQAVLDDMRAKWQSDQVSMDGVDLSHIVNFQPDDSEPEIGRIQGDPGLFPADCMLPPGFIAEVARYSLETSDEPQPILSLGGAMCLLSVLTGRKIRNSRNNRTNLFVLGLGPSGCGKDRPREVNVDILAKIGHPELIGPISIGSGHGFESQLRCHPAKLCQLDEIGDLLKAIKKERGSGHMEAILQKIKMLMTSSHQIYTNSATSDSKSFFTINQPHLVIFGTSTPEKFWANLSLDSIEDGFMGRILPLEIIGYSETQHPKMLEIPDSILEQARAWAEFSPGGNLATENPTPVTFEMTTEAFLRHSSYCQAIDGKIPKDGSHKPTDGLWKRARGRAASLALLFAASRQGPTHFGTIDILDVNLAIKIVNWVTRRTIYKIATQMSENQFQKDCNRVFAIIKQRPVDRTTLCNKTPWLKRNERNEIVSYLIERGDLIVEEVKGKTNVKCLYKCRGI